MKGVVRLPTLPPAVVRLLVLLAAALAGFAVAQLAGIHGVEHSSAYFYAASALLAIGLYGSTHGIDLDEVRQSLRVVVTAVTLGVLLKAAIIALVMYLAFSSSPMYLVFAVAVAQIDPLSTAAAMSGSRLSARAQSILRAWSSFDDPITMLLAIYLSALTLNLLDRESSTLALGGVVTFGVNLVLNLAFAAVVALLWLGVRKIGHARGRQVAEVGLVLAALVVGVWQFLMLGVALIGLIARPAVDRALDRAVRAAFVVAAVGIGVLLVGGISVLPAVVLGLATYFAQVVVGLLLTWRMARTDRIYLALAQQNGITAMILALLLEPDFPGAVAVVAPAILVINLLHSVFTGVYDRRRAAAPPEPVSVRL